MSRPNGRTRAELRDQLAQRDGNRCWLCGLPIDMTLPANAKTGPTLDHVQPVTTGGTNEIDNLRLAHSSCNAARGARPPLNLGPRSRTW